ncbi:hypothetical protein BU14_1356s0004 [Porphyra umbilicalis]|uniref:Uncharacterized protein n=1 Tax=Porphyra umbilicalis TaxID=2786 RepID=A0A1X6NLZ1_PORUM|nr:hypothetical protein BU14_1356s0004 [Porphyra umbilicalis]|eukprot:OSX69608.1 hypothetical protein BU14_1356s0004 [Porphyra umbilicalis]
MAAGRNDVTLCDGPPSGANRGRPPLAVVWLTCRAASTSPRRGARAVRVRGAPAFLLRDRLGRGPSKGGGCAALVRVHSRRQKQRRRGQRDKSRPPIACLYLLRRPSCRAVPFPRVRPAVSPLVSLPAFSPLPPPLYPPRRPLIHRRSGRLPRRPPPPPPLNESPPRPPCPDPRTRRYDRVGERPLPPPPPHAAPRHPPPP